MTVETDTLAMAAQRFSEAIRAERGETIAALENERKAAVKIIEALRRENERRSRGAAGRFVVGFLVGAALGAVAVAVLTPRSGEETRMGLAVNLSGARGTISNKLKSAIEAGKRAASSREQELWSEYRKRIADANKPRDDEPFRY